MDDGSPEFPTQDQATSLPFPRGGPIYAPDLVGPLTSVPEFEAAILHELKVLEAELASAGNFDDELSVNELRVFTEEEWVEKALNEEFEDIPGFVDSAQSSEHANEEIGSHSCIPGKENVCSGSSVVEACDSGSCPSSSNAQTSTHSTNAPEVATQKKRKKRGRFFDRNCRASELEGSYFAKVKQLANIKQKQDEDKAAARLHSFGGNSTPAESAITTMDKIERMRSLSFITSSGKALRGKHFFALILFTRYIWSFKAQPSCSSWAKVNPTSSKEHVPLCYPEVVLCVEIFHNKKIHVKTQEFLVLGSQSLTGFRDNIYCITDKLMQTAGENDPSGYIFIEDTFYNDLRNPTSIDYSKPIFDWLKNCKNEAAEKWDYISSGLLKKKQKELLGHMEFSNVPSFKAMNMHQTRLSDLKFRLGARYMYCHQGNCKHSIVIRDMRLIHPEDTENRGEYPVLKFEHRTRQRKCSVCQIYLATKMTVDDKWAPVNPCYFCLNCYFLLHYKEDYTLLYPHTVFDYHHD